VYIVSHIFQKTYFFSVDLKYTPMRAPIYCTGVDGRMGVNKYFQIKILKFFFFDFIECTKNKKEPLFQGV
jgi:hypothetical protein